MFDSQSRGFVILQEVLLCIETNTRTLYFRAHTQSQYHPNSFMCAYIWMANLTLLQDTQHIRDANLSFQPVSDYFVMHSRSLHTNLELNASPTLLYVHILIVNRQDALTHIDCLIVNLQDALTQIDWMPILLYAYTDRCLPHFAPEGTCHSLYFGMHAHTHNAECQFYLASERRRYK